jgi:hypothetical protein
MPALLDKGGIQHADGDNTRLDKGAVEFSSSVVGVPHGYGVCTCVLHASATGNSSSGSVVAVALLDKGGIQHADGDNARLDKGAVEFSVDVAYGTWQGGVFIDLGWILLGKGAVQQADSVGRRMHKGSVQYSSGV